MSSTLSTRSPAQAVALSEFADQLGYAFQALDDLLDAVGDVSAIGKDKGKDLERTTMVSEIGEAATRSSYISYMDAANTALARSGVERGPIQFLLRSIHQLLPRHIRVPATA